MAKRKTGCGSQIIGMGVLVVALIFAVPMCMEAVSPTPAERAAARQRREAEKQFDAARWEAEEAKQAGRRQYLQDCIDNGAFLEVDMRERGATVVVSDLFLGFDFADQETIVSVAWSYLATGARDEMVTVTLEDSRGRTVGHYGQQWTGVGLKMR